MTNDTTPTPTGEEPTDPGITEVRKSEVERQPTAQLPPGVEEEPTVITEKPGGDTFATVTMATVVDDEATLPAAEKLPTAQLPPPTADADVTQITPAQGFAVAPTVQAAPQPAQAYEQFNAGTEAVQATPYADVAPSFNMETPTATPAPFYADPSLYMHYPAQPGMLAQPGMPIPPVPPTARRSRPLLWVILAVVLVLLVSGGAALALIASRTPTNTPTQVLQHFCHGFTTYNAKEVYNTFSAAQQAKTSVAQIQQSFDEIKSLSSFAKITLTCVVSDVQQNGSTGSGKVTITESVSVLGTSTSIPMAVSLSLILENNTWKIDSAATPDDALPTVPAVPTIPSNF